MPYFELFEVRCITIDLKILNNTIHKEKVITSILRREKALKINEKKVVSSVRLPLHHETAPPARGVISLSEVRDAQCAGRNECTALEFLWQS